MLFQLVLTEFEKLRVNCDKGVGGMQNILNLKGGRVTLRKEHGAEARFVLSFKNVMTDVLKLKGGIQHENLNKDSLYNRDSSSQLCHTVTASVSH